MDAWQVLQASYDDRRLPSSANLTLSTVLTSIGAVLLANLLVILASRKGRKLVFDTVETILAIVLVILLLSIVLGLPVGAVYLMLKAISYFVGSLWSAPAVQAAVAALRSNLTST
ncbi:g10396 [Coccomyxa elongata]